MSRLCFLRFRDSTKVLSTDEIARNIFFRNIRILMLSTNDLEKIFEIYQRIFF